MSATERYPWHADLWQKLQGMRTRLPYCFGAGGTVAGFAYLLWVTKPAGMMTACGTCQVLLVHAGASGFNLLEPAETPRTPGKALPSGKRNFRGPSARTRRVLRCLLCQAGLRIVLLHPAEALNIASANALLKMLEEPPAGVVFLLVSHQPQRLLPTIRSRCNTIDMPMPTRDQAQQWLVAKGVEQAARKLAYAGGSPLQALSAQGDVDRLARDVLACLERGVGMDPFTAAAACARIGMVETVTMLQKWLYDLLSVRMTGQARYHDPQAPALQGLGKGVDLPKLLEYQRVVDEARRHALHPLNLELQLEALMIQYTQIFTVRT